MYVFKESLFHLLYVLAENLFGIERWNLVRLNQLRSWLFILSLEEPGKNNQSNHVSFLHKPEKARG